MVTTMVGPVGRLGVDGSAGAPPPAIRPAPPPERGGWEALVDHARAIDPDPAFADLDDEALEVEMRRSAGAAAAATARMLTLIGEFIVRGAWAWQGARTPGEWLSWAIGMAPSTSREMVRVALAMRTFTTTTDQFRRGELSYSKVRAITRCGEPALERLLLVYAQNAPASQLERIVSTFRRLDDPPDPHDERSLTSRHGGTDVRVAVRLPVEVGLHVLALLDRLVDDLDATGQPPDDDLPAEVPGGRPPLDPIAQRRADALAHGLELAVAHLEQDLTGGARTTLVLHGDVDATVDALADDEREPESTGPVRTDVGEASGDATRNAGASAAAASTCRTDAGGRSERYVADSGPARSISVQDRHGGLRRLSRRTLRRLSCDASIRRVTTRDGLPIDVGYTTRAIPFRLREALRARDGTCRFPGCAATRHLHAHHVVHWADGGPTDLANLVLLCGAHHRFIHAHDWTVQPVSDGRFRFSPPDTNEPVPAHLAMVGGDPAASAEAARRRHPLGLQPPGWTGDRLHLDDALGIIAQELGRIPGMAKAA